MRDAPTRPGRSTLARRGVGWVLALALLTSLSLRAQDRDEDESAVRYPIGFFPPVPPVYGDKIADQPPNSSLRIGLRRLVPPEGLVDLAGDTLYPALSRRLFVRTLSQSLEERVAGYRNRRNTLVNELLEQFIALQDESEEKREHELRVFAAKQASAIAALEKEADALRHDLMRSRLGFDLSWNAKRRWNLDKFPPNREPVKIEAEFQVVRAAAFYDEGLVPAQRGLLLELALDLDARARKARGEPSDSADSDAMFFSPETTRLRLPPLLSTEALKRVAVYNGKKAELKKQLRAKLHELEGASPAERAEALGHLADEQWPELHLMEELAEELRPELAPAFVIAPPRQLPPIPQALTNIIESYNEDRDSYYGEMKEAMRKAAADTPARRQDDGTEGADRGADDLAERRKRAAQEAAVAFQRQHVQRFAVLQERYGEIRSALESIARGIRDPKTGRSSSVDVLLQQHMAAMDEFDRFGRASAVYVNYRTAMLQPGLSSEQRRLLFGYALVGLAQPLPYGELLPRSGDKGPILR